MRNVIKSVLAACLIMCVDATVAAAEDNYPSRPVRLTSGFPAGGLADIVSRLIGDKMGALLGQPFIIESRPGAGGTVASARLAKADPDGYTLMMLADSHAINPHVYKDLPYDSLKDFAPVGFIGSVPMILAVHPGVPAKDVKQLVELARKSPNEITYASIGMGSASHLAGETLAEEGKVKLLHVPYRGGGPAQTDLIAGHVKAMFISPIIGLQNIQEKLLVGLAVSSNERLSILPDLPTMREAGFPVDASYWFGLVAPPNTPEPILAKLEQALQQTLAMPDVQERLLKLGAVVRVQGRRDFWQFVKAEIDRWGPIVKRANISP